MKIVKILGITSFVYLIAFIFDWIATLFTLNDSDDVVVSFLGVRIEQFITASELEVQTAILPRAGIMYITTLILVTVIYFIVKKIKDTSK